MKKGLFQDLEDQIVYELSFINNHKDLDTWDHISFVNCDHVDEKDEYIVQFCKVEYLLCTHCVRNMYLWLKGVFSQEDY